MGSEAVSLQKFVEDWSSKAGLGSLPMARAGQGLLVHLHDGAHLIQQARVPNLPPGDKGFAQDAKVRQRALQYSIRSIRRCRARESEAVQLNLVLQASVMRRSASMRTRLRKTRVKYGKASR